MEYIGLVVAVLVIVLVVVTLAKSVALIPQAEAAVIERLGRYTRTVSGQLTLLVPFIDRIRARVDIRERVVSFPPQPVITEDNLTLSIDTVVYFQVTNPRSAVYEIDDYIAGVEQLTITTLRNVVGGMTLEETLTSRDSINGQLRGVLDEATGRWGLRVARVELKSIMPPPSIQESMEKQMKADREKRATILAAEGQRESAIKTAEGAKQSQILSAEGAKQAAILSAEAERQSRILRAQGDRAATYLKAQGEAKAIQKTFAAVKASKPTPEILAYQYLQQIPEMAKGEASKVWVLPTDFGSALQGFAKSFGVKGDDGVFRYEPADDIPADVDESDTEGWFDMTTDPRVARAVAEAEAVARQPVEPDAPLRAATRRSIPADTTSSGALDAAPGFAAAPAVESAAPTDTAEPSS
ncbi:SPFH domain-containing protein/band 7 family protein [Gordonia polyisoprenivorans VH2]|uniref:SPFH domain-containing protein/band 7 family protein n=2 Tax=Gordonia polyisoprenivorans TaxID=84595 RepID=H6N1Q7_GORPV|nr:MULTISPECIES: SPFH domain-containing protein [Gordonia]AFA73376.1 SPFH domain-containing protein/band 7 family protein [Gordonia polyisoprenivorans VH2]MDF3281847.1 SPFH/Band 7/PHB domain protein [Gordonia sp. N1V]NKY02343.1 SPFH/Band 7/PHB domain protein [Gordonia polyisoprenivorans]OZC34097.1 SPFH/Band 7/PHB domain protein [Gordonia polyisoprenivorans]QUD85128.1 SPFH/Band 7/PHB domain protein [Gordonia polyisoprenivorans]